MQIGDWNASMRDWSERTQRWVSVAFAVCVTALGLCGSWFQGSAFQQPDASIYLEMAHGGPGMMPFASRQLGPLLARGLAQAPGVTVERGFVVEGLLALAILACIVGFLTVRSGAPRWVLLAVGGLCFWTMQFAGLVLPDLLYAALLAVLLLLIRREWWMAAALMMLPLMLARESTWLTLACLLWAARRHMHRGQMAVAVGAAAVGGWVVHWLAARALPNQEGLPSLLYLAAKLPFNLLRNVLGVDVWANVYPSCGVPVWQMPVALGSLRAIGACGMDWIEPVWMLGSALAAFGLLPLLLLRTRGACWRRGLVLIRFCVLYGAASFALAPLLGQSFLRLFEYGWPLFLVALPLLLAAVTGFRSRGWAAAFVALHLALSWMAWRVDGFRLLEFGIATYVVGGLLLWRGFVPRRQPDATG